MTETATAINTKEKVNISKQLEDAREFLGKKIKEVNEKYLKKHYQKPLENVEKVYDRLNEKRLTIETDARKKLEKSYQRGKDLVLKQPIYTTIEKKMTNGFNALPSLINLPAKKDIQNLTLALETLNANVIELRKQNS